MLESFLTFVYYLIMAVILVIVCGYWWGAWYSTPTGQDETFYLSSDDGWRLAVHHYRPHGGPRGLPVILCHGLSSNRYSFDLPGSPGLARFLRDHGRDVWVAELRGSGMSDRPGLFRADVPYSWVFEDHLGSDLPAIIARVLELTGAPGAHWVGHSMGGLLVLAYLAQHDNPRLISAVTVGSPADFAKIHNKAFRTLLNFRGLLKYLPFSPLPFLARLVIPIAHRTSAYIAGPFYPPNTAPLAAKKAVALASQLVTSNAIWLNFGGFLASGRFAPQERQAIPGRSSQIEHPYLCNGGDERFDGSTRLSYRRVPNRRANSGAKMPHIRQRNRVRGRLWPHGSSNGCQG